MAHRNECTSRNQRQRFRVNGWRLDGAEFDRLPALCIGRVTTRLSAFKSTATEAPVTPPSAVPPGQPPPLRAVALA